MRGFGGHPRRVVSSSYQKITHCHGDRVSGFIIKFTSDQ